MYLKSLSVNGFKSFAKKGQFDFSSTISAIVGPNGSGKSNVAEAFRFVLGEQSFKNMRSKKGSDLLFAGQTGQVNRAWVSVTLDNSDKSLDIDYTEVVITRTVLRDGANEYQINGNTVRAKDVVELLAGANVGSSGHHIISQGEADKILTISPRDRKVLVEEALGLKVYTIKKADAQRKLAKTLENLQEVKNQERANTPRLTELKRKVDKIQEARDLRSRLSGLYAEYLPGKFPVSKKLETTKAKGQDATVRLEQLRAQLAELAQEQEVEQTPNTGNDNQSKIAQLEHELAQVRSEKAECDKVIAQAQARIEFTEAQVNQEKTTAVAEDERQDTIARKLHEIVRSWVRARLDSDEFDETTWAHLEAMIAEYDTLSDDIRAEYQAHSQAILDEIYGTQEAKPHTDYETQLAEHRATLESNQAARTKLESCEAELLAQLDDARAQQSNPAQARQELQIKRLKLEQALSNTQYEVQEINRSITDLEQQLGEYQAEESQARELLGREVDEILARASNTDTVDPQLREEIIQTRTLLAHAGAVGGEEIIEEYNSKKKEAEYIAEQLADLEASVARLQELITELDTKLEEKFRAGLEQINRSFDAFFKTLFSGGSAELREVQVPVRNEEEEHELGIEMHVSLPNKKIGSLDVLSGGERSLTSIALLFAMSQVAPPPFIILDETDAALDEANSKRYGDMIEELAKHSQLILITHNRETMSRAGVLYGVTMGDDGVSRLLSVSLEEASAVAK